MHRHFTPLSFALLFGVLVLMPIRGFLQGGDCPEIVQQALAELGDHCQDLSKNTACYGFNLVEATFNQEIPEDFFTKPSDRAELVSVESIATAPLDEELQQWGVAVLSVQANVPNSLPGQSVRFLLFGDTQVENAVPAESALPAVEPIPVVTLVGANIRTRPTSNANVAGSVPAGTELGADGISGDGGWLRVALNERTPGWISTTVIDPAADLSSLPTITADSLSPMQAFYFRTGIGQPSCNEAPNVLVVQGPDNLRVNITANGADIEIGSTIMLKSVDDNQVELTTLNGTARVDNLRIPAGFTATSPLDENGNMVNFSGLRPLTQAELDELAWLQDAPAEVLEYPIDLPDQPTTFTPLPTSANPPPGNTGGNNPPPPSDGSVDCSGFRATSPLDGARYGRNTFYWDAAPGATSYRLNVPGVGSVEVAAPTTNVTFNLASAGPSTFEISWSVDALVNGAVACSTALVTIPRESAPPPMTASWSCSGNGQFTIYYENLPPQDDSIAFFYTPHVSPISPAPGHTISNAPESGSQTFVSSDGFADAMDGSVVSYPSGTTVTLSPQLLFCPDEASS
jgi:hypothetical protein